MLINSGKNYPTHTRPTFIFDCVSCGIILLHYLSVYPLKKFRFLLLLLLLHGQVFSQSGLSGRTYDSANNTPIAGASVLLLKASDSTLASFTRSGKDGRFNLPSLKPGTYNLLVTYPKHADYFETLQLTDAPLNIGNIDIIPLSQLLEAVIIRAQKGKMRLKGDTLIYLADSFKTKANATVEDLLKKLPGLQVNRDGEITAQGKKVERVLVDGEEFFGEDPTLATRNLDAKLVKEVTVYDAQSEEAKRTGDQSAEKVKTLDIRLKEEAKKGYFGKLSVAGSSDMNLYEQRALYSNFKGKRKFSAYGLRGNTSNVGMGWDERNQFGEKQDVSYGGGMMYSTYTSNENDLNYSSGSGGFPRSQDLGMFYGNQWKKHKLNLNLSHRKLDVYNRNTSKRIQLLNNSEIWSFDESNDTNKRFQYKFGAKWEYQIDSLTTLTLNSRGSFGGNNRINRYNTLTSFNNQETINRQIRLGLDTGLNYQVNNTLKLNHPFKKNKRLFTIELNQTMFRQTGANYLQSNNLFKRGLGQFDSLRAGQLRDNITKRNNYNISANYVEPLTKNLELLVGIYHAQDKQWNNLKVLDREASAITIDSLANDYMLGQTRLNASAGLQWHKKKWNISAGIKPQVSGILQEENIKGLSLDKNYHAWLPNANVIWNFSKMGKINMGYNAQVNLPSAFQLQPILNNANPLYLNTGNTTLKQGLSHNYSMNIQAGNMVKQSWLMFSGSFTDYASNFITASSIDSLGRTVSTTEMGSNNNQFNLWGYYHKQIKGTPLGMSIGGGYNSGLTEVIQNNIRGTNTNKSWNFNPTIYMELGDILNLEMEYTYARNNNKSSLQSGFSNKNWTQNLTAGFDLGPVNKHSFSKSKKEEAPEGGWSMSMEYEGNYRQQTNIYSVPNNHLVNGSVYYTHKKKQEYIITLEVNDLLNQNINYSRYVTGNQIYETTNSAFKRYFLLRLTYKFKSKPKSDTKGNNDEKSIN